jgi:GxxExxY protein
MHHRDTENAEGLLDEVTQPVIGAAIEVHRVLGPGLLQSAYEECLAFELNQRGLPFERQRHLPIRYKAIALDCAYRMDLVVQESVVVEVKSVERLEGIHSAQLLTYLRLSGLRVGLLMNFNVPVLRSGLRRLIS